MDPSKALNSVNRYADAETNVLLEEHGIANGFCTLMYTARHLGMQKLGYLLRKTF